MNARSDGRPQFRTRRYPYGVSYKKQHPTSRPWIVKFRRRKRDIYVGVYATLADATLAASEFVRKEIECPSKNCLENTTQNTKAAAGSGNGQKLTP